MARISRAIPKKKRVVVDEDIGPLVSTDMTRCIHCTRCVRFGDEIAGLRELGATGRGEDMRIGTYVKQAMTSELSGNVIDVCPVGALNNKPYRFSARAWELIQYPAVSPHDCVGSNLYLHSLRGEIKRAVPRDNDAINLSWLADRDRYSCHGLYSAQRLTEPLLKDNGEWHTVSWDDALRAITTRLQPIVQQDPTSLGGLISPSATLEEQYLFQHWLRGLGSPHIDHRLQQHDFAADADAAVMPWLGMNLVELEQQDTVLLIGSNVRKDQPLAAYRLRQAALNGASIMLVNAVDYPANFPVSESLIASPQHLTAALMGIVKALHAAADSALSPAWQSALSKISITPQQQTIAEHLLNGDKTAVVLGSQASLHPQYANIQNLAQTIAALSNARYGCLSHGANAAGAWLAGVVPHRLPGGVAVEKNLTGLHARGMLENPRSAYVLFNIEADYDAWHPELALQAFNDASCVIAINSFMSPSLQSHADIILPLASFAETPGTYVNIEGRWQTIAAAAGKPPGEARPGWRILRVLGNLFELPGFDYQTVAEVRDELQQRCVELQLTQSDPPKNPPELPAAALAPASGRLLRLSDIPIYATDPVVRRAEPLQATADGINAGKAALCTTTATTLGLSHATSLSIKLQEQTINLPMRLDDGVPPGCVLIGIGVPGLPLLGPAFAELEVVV